MIKKILKIIVLLGNYGMQLLLAGLGLMSALGGFLNSATDVERALGLVMVVWAVVGAYWVQEMFSKKKKLWQLLAILGVNFLVFQYLTYIG